MNRKEYIAKFSRAVRWRTSATEAEDIISDYEDIWWLYLYMVY